MKYILLLVVSISLLSCQKVEQKVTLRGELQNFNQSFMMKTLSPEAVLLDEGVKISTNDNGKFEVIFDLDQPTYFKMGGYTLYLSPGDVLELNLDAKDYGSATFAGDGAEACAYLSANAVPKAGSYLKAGRLISDKPSHEEVVKRISKQIVARQGELVQLKGVSEPFRRLENARILLDGANSMLKYRFYCPPAPGKSHAVTMDEANKVFYSEIQKYIAGIDNAEYLNLEVYKEVYKILKTDMDKWHIQSFPQEVEDYDLVAGLIHQLSEKGLSNDVVGLRLEVFNKVSDKFKAVIEKAFDSYKGLIPGLVAPELKFYDTEGKLYSLNDFKGKIVVVDVWATWCGPCCKEAPFFEKMANRLGSEQFAFISISVDSNKETWNKYLVEHGKTNHQYLTERINFSNYKMKSIPRFIVIDAEGKIVDAFAKYPSNGLEDVLKGHELAE